MCWGCPGGQALCCAPYTHHLWSSQQLCRIWVLSVSVCRRENSSEKLKASSFLRAANWALAEAGFECRSLTVKPTLPPVHRVAPSAKMLSSLWLMDRELGRFFPYMKTFAERSYTYVYRKKIGWKYNKIVNTGCPWMRLSLLFYPYWKILQTYRKMHRS